MKTMSIKDKKTKRVAAVDNMAKGDKSSLYTEIIEKIGSLKITELNQLIQELQKHFGIDPAMMVANTNASQTEEKTKDSGLVNLVLTETGQGKVAVIKIIAKITGKGLLEAKKMLDNLPLTVLSQKTEEEATQLQKELQNAGAVAEIK